MIFHVLTLFPEMISEGMSHSIIGRAQNAGIISVNAVNIRDFSEDKHKHVDDYPYGGGAGMVMACEPIYKAYDSILQNRPQRSRPRVVYLTPQGQVFNQEMAKSMAESEDIIFLCGHYEGVDERVLDAIVTDRVSIGDYVLSGGELASMVMMDAIARMVPGVLTNEESGSTESFEGNLLEYPQYTRPEEWQGRKVPDVLLSGHHAKIEEWRRQQSILRTLQVRPELLEGAELSKKEKKYLDGLKARMEQERKVTETAEQPANNENV